MAVFIYITIIYFCKWPGTDASSNHSLFLKIETQIQYLFKHCSIPGFFCLLQPYHLTQSCPKLLPCLFPFNIFSISLFLFSFPPSYLLIILPPCSSPLAGNSRITDLLHLNSAAYLSIQVLQSCMIPVTWQPLWAS